MVAAIGSEKSPPFQGGLFCWRWVETWCQVYTYDKGNAGLERKTGIYLAHLYTGAQLKKGKHGVGSEH